MVASKVERILYLFLSKVDGIFGVIHIQKGGSEGMREFREMVL